VHFFFEVLTKFVLITGKPLRGVINKVSFHFISRLVGEEIVVFGGKFAYQSISRESQHLSGQSDKLSFRVWS